MELERSLLSSPFASAPEGAAEDESALAADRMDIEAAEILAALSHSKKRVAVTVYPEFGAKWGCKGRRVKKRAGSSSNESPPSGAGSNPIHSGSDLVEDQATAGQEQNQVTSTSVLIESVEVESSHPCTERYNSRQDVTEAEKETCRLHGMLTNNEFDWQTIHERPMWEDEVAGAKQVKTEQNAESVKSSPTSAANHMPIGVRRSRQNLTEAEKEARRLRRILANRESARQTIRRRQALCEKLTQKVTDLTRENEKFKEGKCGFSDRTISSIQQSLLLTFRFEIEEYNCYASSFKQILEIIFEFLLILHGSLFNFDYIPAEKAKELALKEYRSQDSTNKHLKAEIAKAMKAEELKITAEHKNSGPSRDYPYFFYNQHPFPPFFWPSVVQSTHPAQSQCGNQNSVFVPSSVSSIANGRFDSSFDQENPVNVNGPKTDLYVVPHPWFFSRPDHTSVHLQSSCGPKGVEDEPSVSNRFNAGCSLEPVANEEKCISFLPVEVGKECYGRIEANCTSVRLPADRSGPFMFHIKEEVLAQTPLCSAGNEFVSEQENRADHVVKTEHAPERALRFAGELPNDNQESINNTSKEVLNAVTATEARKRRKELTKLKNLHGRQRTPLSLSAKI